MYTIIVHDEPSTQCCVPVCAASSASNAWHSLPRIYWPERSARNAASSTSAFTKHFDNGIFCINLIIRVITRINANYLFSYNSRKFA